MIEYARGDAGLFNYAVAIKQGGDPAQVELVRFNRPAAEDHPGVGGVVGDGVEHFARTLGFRVDVVAARVDKLQRRDNVVGGVVDIKQRTVRAAQRFGQHEGQLDFDTRNDKAVGGNIAAVVEEHIVEQRAVVRLADLRAGLHRFRGQADLVAFEHAAFGDLHLDPLALDGVGVLNGDRRIIQRDRADLFTLLFGLVQPLGNQGTGLFIEHRDSCGIALPDGASLIRPTNSWPL
ncbi:AraC family regulatory protein [Klebsiella pneumoniae ISC21]|nr:AraC family regulatory protein [Klebsiella pneumoniae ISC21]